MSCDWEDWEHAIRHAYKRENGLKLEFRRNRNGLGVSCRCCRDTLSNFYHCKLRLVIPDESGNLAHPRFHIITRCVRVVSGRDGSHHYWLVCWLCCHSLPEEVYSKEVHIPVPSEIAHPSKSYLYLSGLWKALPHLQTFATNFNSNLERRQDWENAGAAWFNHSYSPPGI